MIICIPVYDQVDLIDVAVPYEIFQWLNQYGESVDVQLAAATAGTITTRDKLTLTAPMSFADVARVDVLWVPGGHPDALKALMNDTVFKNFLRTWSQNARYVCSVCEGAMLLAAAGLLDGYEATTHWAFIPCLKRFANVKVAEGTPRFVVDRNRVTGGGISSSFDEALKLVELLTSTDLAKTIQRTTQYYPCPPVSSALPPAVGCPLDEAPPS